MRDDALQTVARVASQLEPIEHRRKALVCIGAQDVCDVYLKMPKSSLLWNSWRDALSATARANASVYALNPAGVEGRFDLGQGLVDDSGGAIFGRSNDFERDAQALWEQAGHYYLLGYSSTAPPRDLHSVDISMRHSNLHVLARHFRGN